LENSITWWIRSHNVVHLCEKLYCKNKKSNNLVDFSARLTGKCLILKNFHYWMSLVKAYNYIRREDIELKMYIIVVT